MTTWRAVPRRTVLGAAGVAGAALALAGCTDAPAVAPSASASAAPPAVPDAGPPPQPRPATNLTLSPVGDAPATARGVTELTVGTDGVWANPYDPAQVDLQIIFTGPAEERLVAPAYWHQEYTSDGSAFAGPAQWRVRVNLPVPGKWRAVAQLAVPALRSAAAEVEVGPAVAADARGFVRVVGRGFQFDDGTPFSPVGPNVCWSRSPGAAGVLADYGRWLGRLGASGGTAIRIWMASWSFGLEWKDTGLGDYTKRMQRAWLLDRVLDLAHRHGIRVLLAINNHGQFSKTYNTEWVDNPYNAANGGPLAEPEGLTTDPVAQKMFQRRLRYLAARWAAHPALWSWEWFNEVNLTPLSDDRLVPWLKIMTPVLRAHDPYRHPITNSYGSGAESVIWRQPELDFACTHTYNTTDPVRQLGDQAKVERERAAGKPVVLAEYGASGGADDPKADPEGIHWRSGLWAAPMAGFASPAMYWWWDEYIDEINIWHQVRGPAAFFAGERLGDLTPVKPAVTGAVVALALRAPKRVLAWVRAADYTVEGAKAAYTDAVKAALRNNKPLTYTYAPPRVSGATLTLTGLADGRWTARWFSTVDGAETGKLPVTVAGSRVTLAVPDLVRDIAVKLERA